MKTRLILDAMGGDYSPKANLDGLLQALPHFLNSYGELILLGDEQQIRSILSQQKFRPLLELTENSSSSFRVKIRHTTQIIQMDDSIQAIRTKSDSALNLGCQMAGQSYQNRTEENPPYGFISAGHSGALVTSALLHMHCLGKISRPALAVKIPTLSPDGCILIDAGATVDCKPENLRDFAMLGALYAKIETSSHPRIAILSNGEERNKGNELTRAASLLIEKLPLRALGQFIGYAESREVFHGQVDVIVTEGFIGNIILKSIESIGPVFTAMLKKERKYNPLYSLGFLLASGAFSLFKKKLEYSEYGAAPLLGVKGYVFVCHGRSNAKAIKNALLSAHLSMQGKTVEQIETSLTLFDPPTGFTSGDLDLKKRPLFQEQRL